MLKAQGKTLPIAYGNHNSVINYNANMMGDAGIFYVSCESCTNMPGADGWVILFVLPILEGNGSEDGRYVLQIALEPVAGKAFTRRYLGGASQMWTPWKELASS